MRTFIRLAFVKPFNGLVPAKQYFLVITRTIKI